MEDREIRFDGKWYRVGEQITLKTKIRFLYWKLPIWYDKKYVVEFIGDDCSALLRDVDGEKKTITGSVNITKPLTN